jgi:hypothetical protein
MKNNLRIGAKKSKIKPTREHEKKTLAIRKKRKNGKNKKKNKKNKRNAPRIKTQLNSE